MTEQALQRKCVNHAIDSQIICHKIDSASSRGWPDLILVFPGGEFVLVELKNPNGSGKLSALQIHMIQQLTNQGATVHVIDNLTDFADMCRRHLHAA